MLGQTDSIVYITNSFTWLDSARVEPEIERLDFVPRGFSEPAIISLGRSFYPK